MYDELLDSCPAVVGVGTWSCAVRLPGDVSHGNELEEWPWLEMMFPSFQVSEQEDQDGEYMPCI